VDNSLENKLNLLFNKESTFGFLVTFVCFKGDSPSLVVIAYSDGKCVAATLHVQDANSSRGLPLAVGKLCLHNFVRSNVHVNPCSIGFSPNNSTTTLINAHVSKLVKAI
jgi:hypothetical protein